MVTVNLRHSKPDQTLNTEYDNTKTTAEINNQFSQEKRSYTKIRQNSFPNDIANFIAHNKRIAIVKTFNKTHIGLSDDVQLGR